ncbi:hypothetical protein ES705_02205 [subsurface metagenome]|nr:cupin domain-containing protein [Clostridia bacterium]
MLENKLTSSVCNLKIPLTLSKNEKWKSFPIFEGMTAGLLEISCHVLALAKDHSQHDKHNHDEEEILFLLSGSANLIHPDSNDLGKNGNMDLKEGQFVYYPAHFSHTLKTTSDIPANCLTLKWKTNSKNKNSGLNFAYFSIPDNKDNQKNNKFFIKPVFEGSTLYLQKLHCHMSVMNSGGGVKTHRDIYDVVSIILEGEVETLGKKATPYDVIFYATGEPHSIYNRGNNAAREVAFEFHTNKVSLIIRIPYLLSYYFHKLIKLKFWKSKLKKILRF